MPQIDTLTVMLICLAVSFFLSEIFYKLKYPRVIGQILAGAVLGIPLFKQFLPANTMGELKILSDIGIIFLLLLTGMRINVSKFKKSEKDSLIIAVWSACVPFAMGFLLMKFLGYPNLTALVLGTALSITSEGTNLKILLEDKLLNTRVGCIMIEASILDDIFEMLFLAIIILMAHGTASEFMMFPVKILLFVVIAYLSYKLFPKFLTALHKEHSKVATFSGTIIFAIIIAVIALKLGIGPVIGAFIAGVIIQLSEKRYKKEKKEEVNELELMIFGFIVPFFFINIGLNLDFASIWQNLGMVALVIIVAISSKVIGALLTTPFVSLTLMQTYLIGWAMNSRGAIELVIAEVARQNNLIGPEIYSAIVCMALVTTLIFPFVLKRMLAKDKAIMY